LPEPTVLARRRVALEANARSRLLGGEPADGPRHIWWNFVSSSAARINAARADWKAGRFGMVPGETEFIPLPAPPVNYP
jgi:redox-sensitive bicupin YhaK (pirin superfamily)